MRDLVPTWVGATAKQIARAVRRGDTSATQVVADHLDHVALADPAVSAFRVVRAGEAIAESEKVDEQHDLGNLPLAGVPIAVKENTSVAGLPLWNGSAAVRTDALCESDHEVVRRLRGAGAVVVGVTRMPELGLWAVTDDPDAVTRNPWRTDRTPGGSSGGAAAAVASGMVPMAHGTDGLGSIRIPAACCGLVGVKPGRGVVPGERDEHDNWFGLSEHGILATTVADAAVGLDVLVGRKAEKLVEPSRLRVAVALRPPLPGVRLDTANRDAVAAASRLLTAAGHDTVSAEPGYPPSLGLRVLATWCAAAHRMAAAAELDLRRSQPRTRRHAAIGQWAYRRGYTREAYRTAWRERSIGFFSANSFDLLLTPALAATPPGASGWAKRCWTTNMRSSLRFAPFCAPWNVAGLPAIVVPVGVRPDGLPLAVQLVGPPGTERLLLAVAGQFELAAPWRRHAPGFPRASTRV